VAGYAIGVLVTGLVTDDDLEAVANEVRAQVPQINKYHLAALPPHTLPSQPTESHSVETRNADPTDCIREVQIEPAAKGLHHQADQDEDERCSNEHLVETVLATLGPDRIATILQ
jgi:hypothetical protein